MCNCAKFFYSYKKFQLEILNNFPICTKGTAIAVQIHICVCILIGYINSVYFYSKNIQNISEIYYF